MIDNSDDYKFGEAPSWERMQKALIRGGLGFWKMVQEEDDRIIFDPDDTVLTILELRRSDVPRDLGEMLNKYFYPEGREELSKVMHDCFNGIISNFDLEILLALPDNNQECWVRIFGDVAEKDTDGRILLVSGCLQNIQAQYDARAKLKASLEENKTAFKRACIMIDSMPMISDLWISNQPNTDPNNVVMPITKFLSEDDLAGRDKVELTLLDVNKITLTLFGVPSKEMYFSVFNKLSPEFQPNGQLSELLSAEMLGKAIQEGTITFEWMHQKLDGTPVPSEVTLTRIPYGEEIILFSYMRDLTAMKAAQIKLDAAVEEKKAVDERIRVMFDTLPIVCNFWDTNPRNMSEFKTKIPLADLPNKYACPIETNSAAMLLFDLPDRQSYLKNFEKLSPEFQPNGIPSKELILRHLNKVFCEGGSHVFEWTHQKLDGTPIATEVTLIRVSSGDDYTLVAYIRDLRALKAAQSAMLMERLLLEKIMDSTPICFTITVDDTIKFITPFAQQFTGCKIGDDISTIYPSIQAYHQFKNKQKRNKIISWHAVKIKRFDGELQSMLLNSFETDYYGEVGVMSWLIDVTEMRQKNQELYQARKVAEESTKAKSNFLANMSHEIRTPMNAILGLLHLLMQSKLNATQRGYLAKTENAAKALLRIISDILDFSKIEAGKLEMETEIFYLDEVLQSVTDLVSNSIHEKGLEYIVDVQQGTPRGLIGDQVRLVQVLSNLVGNAAKFTKQGQIVVKIETVSESPTEVTLRCLVQDSGIGLTKAQVETLFSAFTQADTSTTRRYGGTGLGLVICKRLVGMMGGSIWVESEYGHGTTFGFTATFGRHSEPSKYDLDVNTGFRGFSALVIDDNQTTLECLSTFLESIGLRLEKAMSGHEALSILTDWKKRGESFDLVFIDWKMPDMDGIETTSRINQLIAPAKLPVVMMVTAYNHEKVLGLAEDVGIETIIIKPVSPSIIVNVLSDIFGRRLAIVEEEAKEYKDKEQLLVKDFVGAKILLAEDNEVNQLVASCILKGAGLEVDIANNGREAVEMAKTGQYELILMDIQMPEMDGMTATREIRSIQKFKNLPILAMTANAMSGDREMSIKAGMDDHINKPIDLHEMFSTLAKWLRKNRKLRKNMENKP